MSEFESVGTILQRMLEQGYWPKLSQGILDEQADQTLVRIGKKLDHIQAVLDEITLELGGTKSSV